MSILGSSLGACEKCWDNPCTCGWDGSPGHQIKRLTEEAKTALGKAAEYKRERDALRAELAITRRVIDRIGQLCTTPHESKERFIRRVQSVIEWERAAQQGQPQ